MSFRFSWKFFDLDDLYATCKTAITESIATAKRPPEMAEPLRVVDIEFGQRPPELGLQTIAEVSETRAHLVFKLKYDGEAQITLESMVQASALAVMLASSPATLPAFLKPKILGAHSGLKLPFQIKVSKVQLDTLVDVVYTKHGIVVFFRNNPVQSVHAETNLDILPGVTSMISKVVKEALADTFEEDVPEVIFQSRSSLARFPDPTFGARRALKQFVVHTRFLELGLTSKAPAQRKFYNTLSLSQTVEHAIPARQCLERAAAPSSAPLNVEDILERSPHTDSEGSVSISIDSISDFAESRYYQQRKKRKPSRRVIKLRKPEDTPPLTWSESPVFDSPPHPPTMRRYSIPALGEFGHHKFRTGSLQPPDRPFIESSP